jgi:hypothetical protein
VARVEAMLTWLLVAVMLLIIGTQVGRMDATILFNLPSHFTFEPYGIFLFAMLGLNVIPEMEDMVSGKREDLIRSVTLGTLGAGVLTYAFGVSAWLASSGALGRNPVELIAFLPPVVAILVPLFGFLAVITSYITSAYDLGAQFHLDFSIPEGLSWMTALGVPFLLLLLGSNDFIDVIGLVGSVFSASAAAVAVLVGRAALRASTRKRVRIGQKAWWWNEAVPLLICALLFLGAVGWLLLD